MKIAKKAIQKNVILNLEYYAATQLKRMLDNEEVFFFSGDYGLKTSHSIDEWRELGEPVIRIYTEKLAEIKVELDDGFYTTVAVGKDGTKYYISLT